MGEFPKAPLWCCLKIQNGFAFNSDLFGSNPSDLPLVRIRDIKAKDFETYIPRGSVPSEDYLVIDGDIIVGMDGDFNSIVWDKGTSALNQRVCKVIPNDDVDSRFIFYSLQEPLKHINDLKFSTTVKHLAPEDLYSTRIPIPPLETQRRIADYLDKETSEIDTLTAELDGYVELLERRRSAAIIHAVTQGIGGGACNEFPAVKLHLFCKFLSGSGFPISEQGVVDQEFPFYKVASLSRVASDGLTIDDGSNSVSADTAKQLGATLIPPNSALVAKIGEAVRLKRVRVNKQTCCIDNNMLALAPSLSTVDSRFFPYALAVLNIELLVTPGTIPTLNMSALRNYEVPLPDLETQRRIADYLDKETARIDTLIKECRELKEILLKRRQVLITDVVTGKVEV